MLSVPTPWPTKREIICWNSCACQWLLSSGFHFKALWLWINLYFCKFQSLHLKNGNQNTYLPELSWKLKLISSGEILCQPQSIIQVLLLGRENGQSCEKWGRVRKAQSLWKWQWENQGDESTESMDKYCRLGSQEADDRISSEGQDVYKTDHQILWKEVEGCRVGQREKLIWQRAEEWGSSTRVFLW